MEDSRPAAGSLASMWFLGLTQLKFCGIKSVLQKAAKKSDRIGANRREWSSIEDEERHKNCKNHMYSSTTTPTLSWDLHIFIGVWNYLIEFVWKFLLN